jgi:tetratricopeptide (TPR) repeat protein
MIFLMGIGLLSGCKKAEDYLSEGQDLCAAGKFNAALVTLEKAIEKNQYLKDAYIQLGLCLESLNRPDSALFVYTKLLHMYPDNTAAYYYSGICKYRQEKFDEAVVFFNKALDTKGGFNSADSTSIQALIDLNKDNFESESEEMVIPTREIIYDRGMAYYKTGEIKNAFLDFTSCIVQKYNTGDSYNMLGLCKLKNDDKKYGRRVLSTY